MDIPEGYQELAGSRRGAAAGARRIGDADPGEVMAVTITVRRQPAAPPLPDPAASQAWQDRRPLSREEFARTYGAADPDLRRVEQFAVRHGLTVTEVSAARRTVRVSGTAAQMRAAFAVDLGRYQSQAGTYRGREGVIYIPAELADVVEGVFGLDNRRMARPVLSRLASPAEVISALTPPQVASLYDFPKGPASGQTIGLLEFGGGYQLSDIRKFFHGLGFTPPSPTDVTVLGPGNSFGGGTDEDIEVALDIDVAGSVGHGANIAVYWTTWSEDGWVEGVSKAVHDAVNNPSVLSISWGWAEHWAAGQVDWTDGAINDVSTRFKEAAAMGVTVLVASGDDGSNCQIGDGKAHVLYPASDPYVTACGGTTINGGWGHTNLTVRAGATQLPATPGSPLDGYATAWNNQQHVNYLSQDRSGELHVCELAYKQGSGWGVTDLTARAHHNPAPAAQGSPLDGYATAWNNQQHVNYLSQDRSGELHVCELAYADGSGWGFTDLTASAAVTGALLPRAGSPLDGYATPWNRQQHVNYIGQDANVHELAYAGRWKHTRLTANTCAFPVPGGASTLDGYATDRNHQQRVNYLDAAGHVHELWYSDSASWGHNELNAPVAAPGSPLDGYTTGWNRQQHVNFLDAAGHVHELWHSDGSAPTTSFTETTWNDNGITGGGVSDRFRTVPAWQASAGVPGSVNDGHVGRGVPDVAGNADPDSGYVLVIKGASTSPIGGTSAAAPLYAGLVALLNASRGKPAGYLNPILYALAADRLTEPFVFRDIADHRNNAAGGAPGYTCCVGWDACTGLGSIDGNAFLTALD